MTAAAGPLGGHLLHAVPLLVPVVATAVVLGPDLVRRGARSLWRVPSPPVPPGLLAAAAGTAAAALVHLVVLPEHLEESWLYGAFFLALALVQGAGAWLLLLEPRRALLVVAVAGNAAVVALWAVTRTVGLPFGPFVAQVEQVGPLDLAAVVSETAAIVACAAVLVRARRWLPVS